MSLFNKIVIMTNKFVISILGVFLAFIQVAWSQDLDPTVVVTREYQGKLVETHKPSIEMSVPDSVTRFALDFDYSVFENPYKGSYDFNPYLLTMKPSAADLGENILYLRAGAGYQLHPELDLVWSPKFRKQGFNMDVYALHRSFIGNYWRIEPKEVSGGVFSLTRPSKGAADRTWSGYDLLSRAGVDCRVDTRGLAVDFGAGYYGLAQKDRIWRRNFNALHAGLGLGTKPESSESAVFDMDVDYRFGQDFIFWTSRPVQGGGVLNEHLVDFDLSFGPVQMKRHKLLFDFKVDLASYGGAMTAQAANISLIPRYVFGKDRVTFDVGLDISKILRGQSNGGLFDTKEQYVYPDVTFSYVLFPESLKFHLTAKGGNDLDTYSSLLADNHHLVYDYTDLPLDFTVERVSLAAGFDGRISSRFSYDVRGGYVNYANALLESVVLGSGMPRSSIAYSSYQKWFVAMDWCLKTEDFRFDGSLSYDHVWDGIFDEPQTGIAVLKPAALTGDVSAEYNWKRRMFFGVDCSFMTARKGMTRSLESADGFMSSVSCSVPGYADLGLSAEYVTSRGLSFWLRAGNLLNMTIQRNPLYAEKGVNFTAGICLSL